MSKNNNDVDRLMRLRQQQLKARDPHAKQRTIDRKVAARRRKRKRQVSFRDVITDVPRKWQGIILGALFGMVVWVGLSLLVVASWVDLAGIGAIIVLAVLGFFFGQALDTRDELKDLVNH